MRGNGWVLVIGLVALVGIVVQEPLMVAVALALFLVESLAPAWTRASLRRVNYRRSVHPRCAFPGEPMAVAVQVENDKFLPVSWLQIEDQNPREAVWEKGRLGPHHLPSRQVLIQVLALGWFQRVTRHYRVTLPRRGFYEFGPARLTAGDPFGLAETEIEAPAVERVVIYPRLLDPLQLQKLWHQAGGQYTVRHGLLDDPTRLAGVRLYQPGDAWRRIHWKATAHSGMLQVKVFEPAVDPGTAVFLDVRTYPNPWDGYHPGRLEAAISLAASIYREEVLQKRRVGLFANGYMAEWGPGPAYPLTADPGQLPGVLESLGRLVPLASGEIADVMAKALSRLPRGTALVVITCLDQADLRAILERAAGLGFPTLVLWLGDLPAPPMPMQVAVQALSWEKMV